MPSHLISDAHEWINEFPTALIGGRLPRPRGKTTVCCRGPVLQRYDRVSLDKRLDRFPAASSGITDLYTKPATARGPAFRWVGGLVWSSLPPLREV